MKICRIYSDDESKFHNIKFSEGLNVIQASITDYASQTKVVHNLGKSRLIELIDFLLLKKVSKKDFFLTNGNFSGEFYFIEIRLDSGGFLVVRRGTDFSTKIAFKKNHVALDYFQTNLDWDEDDVPFERARDYLNERLKFSVLPQCSYRKSISYFLRSQGDYDDVYRLGKFKRGKDKDWKPFMFALLGFDGELIEKKYELEGRVDELQKRLRTLEKDANIKTGEKDKLIGLIDIKQEEVVSASERIDKFNFYEKDKDQNAILVERLDGSIQELNTLRYNYAFEIKKTEDSLRNEMGSIDADKLKNLFAEVELFFPDELQKNFDGLLSFNKEINAERSQVLKDNLSRISQELETVDERLRVLETEKQNILQYLTEKDSYEKFKENQKQLALLEAEVIDLKNRLNMADRTDGIEVEIQNAKDDIESAIENIGKAIVEQKHAGIRRSFNKIIKTILDKNALLSLKQNKSGNVEFLADIQDSASITTTAEADGTTYKKLLCMAFDLSLLMAHSKQSFFHFVYHDGGLEAIESRKARIYIDEVRTICKEHDIQYILTLIDSDLPRDKDGHVLEFSETEICLRLHDKNDSGKLFKRSF